MLKNIFLWILQNVFKIKTETTSKELQDNDIYAVEYEKINDINFNSIFSNKLANYVVNDSNINLEGKNKRVELLDKVLQSMWKKGKKIVSMAFGYGGVIIVPFVKGGKIFYDVVPQNRLTIDAVEGENIIGATVLAERKEVQQMIGNPKIYLRWTNYRVVNGNIVIEQQYTDEQGHKVDTPNFWKNILDKQTIGGVDRVLFGYLKSPVNNRRANDKYGVPITYGCEATIREIKDTMKQLWREYKLKEAFVGVDKLMFGKDDQLPRDGLFKKVDAEDGFWEVYDPAFRSYVDRLTELYKRLEHEIGTSAGVISEVTTQNATATEIKRAMYDTFTIVDDMRTNIEKAIDDFMYSANVLANAYNLTANGEYNVSYDWSYSLLEDNQETFNQLVVANGKGIVSNAELRQYIYPDETIEESQKAVEEIKGEQEEDNDFKKIVGNADENDEDEKSEPKKKEE